MSNQRFLFASVGACCIFLLSYFAATAAHPALKQRARRKSDKKNTKSTKSPKKTPAKTETSVPKTSVDSPAVQVETSTVPVEENVQGQELSGNNRTEMSLEVESLSAPQVEKVFVSPTTNETKSDNVSEVPVAPETESTDEEVFQVDPRVVYSEDNLISKYAYGQLLDYPSDDDEFASALAATVLKAVQTVSVPSEPEVVIPTIHCKSVHSPVADFVLTADMLEHSEDNLVAKYAYYQERFAQDDVKPVESVIKTEPVKKVPVLGRDSAIEVTPQVVTPPEVISHEVSASFPSESPLISESKLEPVSAKLPSESPLTVETKLEPVPQRRLSCASMNSNESKPLFSSPKIIGPTLSKFVDFHESAIKKVASLTSPLTCQKNKKSTESLPGLAEKASEKAASKVETVPEILDYVPPVKEETSEKVFKEVASESTDASETAATVNESAGKESPVEACIVEDISSEKSSAEIESKSVCVKVGEVNNIPDDVTEVQLDESANKDGNSVEIDEAAQDDTISVATTHSFKSEKEESESDGTANEVEEKSDNLKRPMSTFNLGAAEFVPSFAFQPKLDPSATAFRPGSRKPRRKTKKKKAAPTGADTHTPTLADFISTKKTTESPRSSKKSRRTFAQLCIYGQQCSNRNNGGCQYAHEVFP